MFKRIKSTNDLENNNSLNAFSDNASAIEGYDVKTINSINVDNRYKGNILNSLCQYFIHSLFLIIRSGAREK